MRKNKKTVAKSDFFRRITIADREIDLCQGKIYDGVRFLPFCNYGNDG